MRTTACRGVPAIAGLAFLLPAAGAGEARPPMPAKVPVIVVVEVTQAAGRKVAQELTADFTRPRPVHPDFSKFGSFKLLPAKSFGVAPAAAKGANAFAILRVQVHDYNLVRGGPDQLRIATRYTLYMPSVSKTTGRTTWKPESRRRTRYDSLPGMSLAPGDRAGGPKAPFYIDMVSGPILPMLRLAAVKVRDVKLKTLKDGAGRVTAKIVNRTNTPLACFNFMFGGPACVWQAGDGDPLPPGESTVSLPIEPWRMSRISDAERTTPKVGFLLFAAPREEKKEEKRKE